MEQWVKGGGERISFHKHNEAVKAEKDYIWSVSPKKLKFHIHIKDCKYSLLIMSRPDHKQVAAGQASESPKTTLGHFVHIKQLTYWLPEVTQSWASLRGFVVQSQNPERCLQHVSSLCDHFASWSFFWIDYVSANIQYTIILHHLTWSSYRHIKMFALFE